MKYNKKDIEDWLNENLPHIKLIKWGGKKKAVSTFFDSERKLEFEYIFANMQSSFNRRGTKYFKLSSKERSENFKKIYTKQKIQKAKNKRKQTNIEKYGTEHALQNINVLEKLQKTNIEKYGSKCTLSNKEIRKKIKETNIEKYGVEFVTQNKDVQEKYKKTCLEKYGVDNVSKLKVVKQKKIETCIKNNGVYHPLLLEKFLNKRKNTNLEKYGVEHHLQNQEILNKQKRTNIEKYGHESPMQSEKINKKAIKTKIDKCLIYFPEGKTIPEWSKEPGSASYSTNLVGFRDHGILPSQNKSGRSILELKVENFLDELNIKYVANKKLNEHKGLNTGYKVPDFFLPEHNLIIECDGEYYHTKNKKHIDKERNKLYVSLGYNLLVFSGDQINNNFDYVKKQILKKIEG